MKQFDTKALSNDFSAFVGRGKAVESDLNNLRDKVRNSIDRRIFERDDLEWYQSAYTEAFLFMYDTSFYDRRTDRYRIDEILDDGEREFGGYDIILLWQSYPRLGIDERNQIDFYRDMPGGLSGLRALTDRAHERGVRVFVNYNPWDIGTRREDGTEPLPDSRGYRPGFEASGAPAVADAEALAEVIKAIGADGVFLDTMASDDPGFRSPIVGANPSIVFDPEVVPSLESLSSISGSWLQRKAVEAPSLLTIRWVEPRFSFRATDRDSTDRRQMLNRAFFHGFGNVVWENIFGWWNPWPAADRALLRRSVRLLREYRTAFQDSNWQPYVATLCEGVYAHRWHSATVTVHTFLNESGSSFNGPILAAPIRAADGCKLRYYDVWNGLELKPANEDGSYVLSLSLTSGEAGCIVSAPEGIEVHLSDNQQPRLCESLVSRERVTLDDLSLRAVEPSEIVSVGEKPPDMCHISGGPFTMNVRHNTTAVFEGGCYGSVELLQDKYHPPMKFELVEYWIDRTEVTNEAYQAFLKATHYKPRNLTNFLRHWRHTSKQNQEPWNWQIPADKAKHPVVWIDLDDARAYALWAGKRLPREEEWQRAAGFAIWPWGDRFDPSLCNSGSSDTTAVDQFPEGVSSSGCWDMAGNVWEWTESERNDGHTRYAILRGGSYLKVEGSKWYTASGAQPNDCHEKMLLLYPGLDRCSTIGFRCVKDTQKAYSI